MAPGRLFNNARIALSPRYSPYPTNMPAAQRAQASSSRNSHAQASPERLPPVQPVVLRYEKYQDDMPVKSIEGQEQGFTGVRHYSFMQRQKKLDSKPSLDHIDYRDVGGPSDNPSHDLFEADLDPPTYTGPPSPPLNTVTYNQPIYIGTTHNPSVFLAILRIAQLNLPHMNFVSALNHIPNVAPKDSLPVLISSAPGNLAPIPFLDTTRPEKRIEDVDISVAFLPYFYDQGKRHGIGYFETIHDYKRGNILGTACITPCSEEDLRCYGLVEYIDPKDLMGMIGLPDEGGVEGVDWMSEVGVCGGKWLEKDTVEDWEEWRRTFRTCAVAWENRMGLLRGQLEG